MANRADRNKFYNTVETMFSTADESRLDPLKLLKNLEDSKDLIEKNWADIFHGLIDEPLDNEEKLRVKNIMSSIEKLQKTSKMKVDWVNDFQKYIQLSLDKTP